MTAVSDWWYSHRQQMQIPLEPSNNRCACIAGSETLAVVSFEKIVLASLLLRKAFVKLLLVLRKIFSNDKLTYNWPPCVDFEASLILSYVR